jgi:hypothetical protein
MAFMTVVFLTLKNYFASSKICISLVKKAIFLTYMTFMVMMTF